MNILGVETSCDETAAAVVTDGKTILSNVVASSSEMHTKTGGVIPENAARAQIQSIIPVIQEALYMAFINKTKKGKTLSSTHNSLIANNIDAVAFTAGPGLIGSLLVGVETAKTLSYLWSKPLIPVNHLVAHIYANWLTPVKDCKKAGEYKLPKFPAIALVVSGGHTDLVLMKNHGKIKWIGGTRDDAAGEAFDKCARLLNLSYPGGPSISREADKFINLKSKKINLDLFPRPMINSSDLDFSFSGLKTSVSDRVKREESGIVEVKTKTPQLAAEIQEAIVDSLVAKGVRAIEKYKPRSFLLSGGVAANQRLRVKLRKRLESYKYLEFHVPPMSLCTDNAAMISTAAYYNYEPISWKKVSANPQITIGDAL